MTFKKPGAVRLVKVIVDDVSLEPVDLNELKSTEN